MKIRMFVAMALAGAALAPRPALADEISDRNQAIRLCRAEVAAQAGSTADAVRLDQVRVRGRVVRVDLDLWRNGRLQNVRCDVARAPGELSITSITPTLQTAAQ